MCHYLNRVRKLQMKKHYHYDTKGDTNSLLVHNKLDLKCELCKIKIHLCEAIELDNVLDPMGFSLICRGCNLKLEERRNYL